tara:strand:- start:158 stop:346 length:189 start_codon:yes stop_codon:yes gene_type:complete
MVRPSVKDKQLVFDGIKKKTRSGLSKSNLMVTKDGRIVSKKKHEIGKRQYKKYGHILRQYQF